MTRAEHYEQQADVAFRRYLYFDHAARYETFSLWKLQNEEEAEAAWRLAIEFRVTASKLRSNNLKQTEES